tara:strand:- start:635 stop:1081 length:447 start_codon:yes stop_codon:yes gene_type:complete
MEFSLKKDERIRLYLKVFIPISEICNKIIKIKNGSENKDTLKYHMDRWNAIAGEHYYTRDNHYGKFSYIHNGSNYIIKPDHRLYFYQMTGISYQVIELIYELIQIRNEKTWDFEIDNKEEWLKHDDKLYSELSKRIMNEMKQIKLLFI